MGTPISSVLPLLPDDSSLIIWLSLLQFLLLGQVSQLGMLAWRKAFWLEQFVVSNLNNYLLSLLQMPDMVS